MARAPLRTTGSAAQATETRPAYDAFKEFEGKKYTGMKVGRGHKWQYGPGEWREKKVTPDKWEFHYDVHKGRTGKAPEGSGVPVGTQYHWYILAHQTATKLDANNYTTEMTGLKFKLAHKRADKPTWSASDRAQRKRLIQILKGVITDLENDASEGHANDRVDSGAAAKPAPPVASSAANALRASKRTGSNGHANVKSARAVNNGAAANDSKFAASSSKGASSKGASAKVTGSKAKPRSSKTAKVSRASVPRRAA